MAEVFVTSRYLREANKAIEYMETISKLPTCENCKVKKDCTYAPKLGEYTRINCFAWVQK